MSWWGSHPWYSRAAATEFRLKLGLHSCTRCEYYWRIRHLVIVCPRCCGDVGLIRTACSSPEGIDESDIAEWRRRQ